MGRGMAILGPVMAAGLGVFTSKIPIRVILIQLLTAASSVHNPPARARERAGPS